MNPDALAAVAAAIDGHNPRIRHGSRGLVLDRDGGPSDLAILADQLVYLERPGVGKVLRTNPQTAVMDVARCAVDVVWATAEALGVDPFTVDRAAVADRLRAQVRASHQGAVDAD
ncbi:hypothetical protein [Dietzia kunjamensis]|uniref:hypothetical protein n=1 Tax=Dietzia kunjamensis TaxID=322509 RepID=UPI0039BC94FB